MTFGRWIDHDGTPCPPELIGRVAEVICEADRGDFTRAVETIRGGASWDWSQWGRPQPDGGRAMRLIRYRLQEPDTAAERTWITGKKEVA